ncbi:hypothetical protein NE237_032633 [Protea cynaroides]|uniref:Uncharacterized protein n=1 Tax=Protea cynaroides TaxID=273540 RepID=A0A9Q0L4B9_9MAGN|nr:hypothetical protein NE237_032633 [Protea cynaroides]
METREKTRGSLKAREKTELEDERTKREFEDKRDEGSFLVFDSSLQTKVFFGFSDILDTVGYWTCKMYLIQTLTLRMYLRGYIMPLRKVSEVLLKDQRSVYDVVFCV